MKYLNFADVMMSIAVGLAVGAFVYVCLDSLDMPDVWYSYSTGDCVQVLNHNPEDKYTCENLPRKFNHVWVK